MEVDFNNLRISLIGNFNKLTERLNESAKNGEIAIDINLIERHLENLRSDIVTIGCLFDPKLGFNCVLDDQLHVTEVDIDK